MSHEAAPERLDIHQLPDGTWLMTPHARPASMLQRGQWVRVDGDPWQIADLMQTSSGGKIVFFLDGLRPRVFTAHEPPLVYTVVPAPAPVGAARR